MFELIASVSIAVIVSTVCSLWEAVLYSLPGRQIEAMAEAGKPAGIILKKMRLNVDRPISAILTLNTIAHTAGASVAGSAAVVVFGQENLGYFAAAFTLIILVFTEILPKIAGVVHNRKLATITAHCLKVLVWVMAPGIWLSSLLTSLIGGKKKTEESVTDEELMVMARLSLRTGGIEPFQEKLIGRILTLQDKKVKDVMTPRTVIFSLSEHLTLEEASKQIKIREHSRFPVYDDDIEDIVGMVLAKELLLALSEGKKETHLTELMRPVHFVAETATLDKVFMDFISSREHLFVVIDEYGGLSGLIALEDILEEILGIEIVDESDTVTDKRELARQRRKMVAPKI